MLNTKYGSYKFVCVHKYICTIYGVKYIFYVMYNYISYIIKHIYMLYSVTYA